MTIISTSRWILPATAVVLLLTCLAAGCSSGPAPAPGAATTPSPAAGNTVRIQNFAFDPTSLTVMTGTTVTWVNEDSVPHTVVSGEGDPAVFSSAPIPAGGSYTFTFTAPGTYQYICSIHPSMKGTVIVQG